MNVRMTSGPYAGEVRDLPFLAARRAIGSGLARSLDHESLEAPTVTLQVEPPRSLLGQPVVEDATISPPKLAVGPPSYGHKRHGRRR